MREFVREKRPINPLTDKCPLRASHPTHSHRTRGCLGLESVNMGICPASQWIERLRDGPLGIHVQTMENRRTLARLRSHVLPFLPVPHGKASGCCRARRGSHRQTRQEVRNQRRSRRNGAACRFARLFTGARNGIYSAPLLPPRGFSGPIALRIRSGSKAAGATSR